MPKKTKKEKIIARSRRARIPQTYAETSGAETVEKISTLSYQFTHASSKKTEAARVEDRAELKAIKTDLVKTLFLATAAVAFEITLYVLVYNK